MKLSTTNKLKKSKYAVLAMAFVMAIGCAEDDDAASSTVTITGGQGNVTTSNFGILANSGINPESVHIKVRKVAVSANEDCSSPTTIFSTDSPEYVDMSGSPSIGSGTLANGTYPCVMIEMSDQIRFVPEETSDSGNCVANTTHTVDVCKDNGGGAPSFELIDGTTGTCSTADDTEDFVALFLSTLSTATTGDTGNPFVPATSSDATNGFKLNGSFTVSGDVSSTFTVDFVGKVEDSGSDCDVQPPEFGFE